MMKKKLTFLALSSAIICLITLGFVNAKSIHERSNSEYFKLSKRSESKQLNVDKDLFYQISGQYKTPITKEQLKKASSLKDLITDYPTNWITQYASVEISSFCQGKRRKSINVNDQLNKEQKELFNLVDLSADIFIKVNYISENDATHNLENRTMNLLLTVIPEVEAEFVGGYEQLITYFKENGKDKFPTLNSDWFSEPSIEFIIDKEGKVDHVKQTRHAGNVRTDEILINLIKNMPKWKPAQNSKGETTFQKFTLTLGQFDRC